VQQCLRIAATAWAAVARTARPVDERDATDGYLTIWDGGRPAPGPTLHRPTPVRGFANCLERVQGQDTIRCHLRPVGEPKEDQVRRDQNQTSMTYLGPHVTVFPASA
jgi:hypothetical protein